MIQKRILDCGIPVLFDEVRGVRSAVVGIWVRTGSRHELPGDNGISHFIEHMLFKGTDRMTAEDIAVEIDSMGGDLNAFTSREFTAFYVKVLDEYLIKGIDLLCDIFLHSRFDPAEIEKEKAVIDEEIRMVEDTPDDYVFDLFNREIWGESGLGQTILGKSDTIKSFTREKILSYLGEFYTTDNIIVACAGSIDGERVIEELNRHFGGHASKGRQLRTKMPRFISGTHTHSKDLSEVHICAGFNGLPANDPDRYEMLVLNTILGSGVSSRLFQEIREKRGLVYSINSFIAKYVDGGCIGVYAGASAKNYREVVDLITTESCSLARTLSEEECERAKKQLKGNILLALESSSARMNSIAQQEIYHGRYYSSEEIIEAIEKVEIGKLRMIAERTFEREQMAITLFGPVPERT
ncbi:MAG: M16 family metallopeptidase [Thermodesulfovibrionales bacterium]